MAKELTDNELLQQQQQAELDLDNSFNQAAEEAQSGKTAADPQDKSAAEGVESQPAAPQISASLLEKAKAGGLNLEGINSDAELAEAIYDAFRQQQAVYAQQASVRQPEYDAGTKSKEEDRVARQDEQQAFDLGSHFSGLWKVPQMDEVSKHLINSGVVEIDPNTGAYRAKQGYEILVGPHLHNLNQAHIAHKQQLNKLFEGNFFENSWAAYQPAVEHLIAQQFQKLAGGWQNQQQITQQQAAEEAFISKFESDNAAWLFKTNILGQKSLSPEGQKFSDTVNELRQAGITDPRRLAATAMQLAGIKVGNESTAKAEENKEDRERDGKGRFVSKQESFIDRARRQASESSNSNAYSGDSVVANEGDLDNLWATEWRQRQSAAN